MNEVWKDIEGYEGKYQVSNLGRVRGLDRKNSMGKTVKGRILKPRKTHAGYLRAHLCRDDRYIHRLVAEAFIPNPNNLPQINHKDEDKANNSVDNLEWCTCEYNLSYGSREDYKKRFAKNTMSK